MMLASMLRVIFVIDSENARRSSADQRSKQVWPRYVLVVPRAPGRDVGYSSYPLGVSDRWTNFPVNVGPNM
jgi:hypothetical protein